VDGQRSIVFNLEKPGYQVSVSKLVYFKTNTNQFLIS